MSHASICISRPNVSSISTNHKLFSVLIISVLLVVYEMVAGISHLTLKQIIWTNVLLQGLPMLIAFPALLLPQNEPVPGIEYNLVYSLLYVPYLSFLASGLFIAWAWPFLSPCIDDGKKHDQIWYFVIWWSVFHMVNKISSHQKQGRDIHHCFTSMRVVTCQRDGDITLAWYGIYQWCWWSSYHCLWAAVFQCRSKWWLLVFWYVAHHDLVDNDGNCIGISTHHCCFWGSMLVSLKKWDQHGSFVRS